MLVKNLYRAFAANNNPNNVYSSQPIQYYLFTYYGDPSLSSEAIIKVGSGNTPVTFEDTALAAEITSSVLQVTNTGVYRRRTGAAITITRTYKNISNSDVTVREIAMFGGSSSNSMALRELLPTPVVVPVGETRTFKATINVLETARVQANLKSNLTVNNMVSRDGFTYSRESNYDGAGNSPFCNKQTSNWFPDVGFGTAPLTYQETDLADSNRFRDSSLPKLSISNVAFQSVDYRPAILMTFDVTNPTQQTLAVTETGLWWKPSSGTGSDKYYLMFRDVLSSPVVISPGETIPFTIRVYIDI
jgi:hypothetical protein